MTVSSTPTPVVLPRTQGLIPPRCPDERTRVSDKAPGHHRRVHRTYSCPRGGGHMGFAVVAGEVTELATNHAHEAIRAIASAVTQVAGEVEQMANADR